MSVRFRLRFGGPLFLLLLFSISLAFILTYPRDLSKCECSIPYIFVVFNTLSSKNTFTLSSGGFFSHCRSFEELLNSWLDNSSLLLGREQLA